MEDIYSDFDWVKEHHLEQQEKVLEEADNLLRLVRSGAIKRNKQAILQTYKKIVDLTSRSDEETNSNT